MSYAFAIGVGTQNNQQEWLEVYFPRPLLNPEQGIVTAVSESLNYSGGNQAIEVDADRLSRLADALSAGGYADQAELANQCKDSERPVVVTILANDEKASTSPRVFVLEGSPIRHQSIFSFRASSVSITLTVPL